MKIKMKLGVFIISMLVFVTSSSFASGGPSFEQLHNKYGKSKPVVKLIVSSEKQQAKQRFCYINTAQNKVEKKPC